MSFEQTATLNKKSGCQTHCGCAKKEAAIQERTLSIIKPDSVSKNNIGGCLNLLEKAGLKIVAMRMLQLSRPQAEEFYAIHKERSFFGELVEFMTSGPVVVLVLEGENAVLKNRDVMGATDPKKASQGTIRAQFGAGIEANAVHGSDSLENARNEITFFFDADDICPRK
jgi:nucleoside-diphosphate kinase